MEPIQPSTPPTGNCSRRRGNSEEEEEEVVELFFCFFCFFNDNDGIALFSMTVLLPTFTCKGSMTVEPSSSWVVKHGVAERSVPAGSKATFRVDGGVKRAESSVSSRTDHRTSPFPRTLGPACRVTDIKRPGCRGDFNLLWLSAVMGRNACQC